LGTPGAFFVFVTHELLLSGNIKATGIIVTPPIKQGPGQTHTRPAGAMKSRCGVAMICGICAALVAIRPASGFAGAPPGAPCLRVARGKSGLLATGLRAPRLAGLPGAACGRREQAATRTSTHGGSARAFDRAGVCTSAVSDKLAEVRGIKTGRQTTRQATRQTVMPTCIHARVHTHAPTNDAGLAGEAPVRQPRQSNSAVRKNVMTRVGTHARTHII
jgi:hypothetical protein